MALFSKFKYRYQKQLDMLSKLGYTNIKYNKTKLKKYKGDANKVIEDYEQETKTQISSYQESNTSANVNTTQQQNQYNTKLNEELTQCIQTHTEKNEAHKIWLQKQAQPIDLMEEQKQYETNESSPQTYTRIYRKSIPTSPVTYTKTDLEDKIELDIYSHSMSSESETKPFQINWKHIANCVAHEMYPKLSSTIRSIINQTGYNVNDNCDIGLFDLDQIHINEMLNILKTKRGLAIEEIIYLRKLCNRAINFTPTFNDEKCHNNIDELTDMYFHLDDGKPTALILQDIFDVHRYFRFSNYHFEEYSLRAFKNDVMKASNKYFNNNYMTQLIKNTEIKEMLSFYPEYIVCDNMFEIFDYFFSVSRYVHYLRNTFKSKLISSFALKVIIIPKLIECVYDENIIFEYDIRSIDEYLLKQKIYEYERTSLDLHDRIQHQYTAELIKKFGIKELILMIDRRHITCKKDVLYIIPSNNRFNFNEFYIGFDFNINVVQNTVVAYFRYGINQKLRFYPQMLFSLIRRYFKKPSNASEVQILNKMYSHKYKNGFSVDLNDDRFDRFYKMITKFTHVSLNYNRLVVYDDFNNPIKQLIFFRDFLEHEMITSKMNKRDISEFNKFLIDNEYDSESIVGDILFKYNAENIASNISNYFISTNKWYQFTDIIEHIVTRYDCKKIKQYNEKSCTLENNLNVHECKYIDYIINSLSKFVNVHFCIDHDTFNLCELLASYDHVVTVHKLFDNETDSITDIKQYIIDMVGFCPLSDCPILRRHNLRRREITKNIDTENDDGQEYTMEIITSTIHAMHSYILHENKISRVTACKNNSHFGTSIDDEDTKVSANLNFGISVLQWLNYSEKPAFKTFHDEIVNNPKSTITERLYLNMAQECFCLLLNRRHKQYMLEELISLKIYTDTNVYQSELRKAHWESSSIQTRKLFYFFALQLYKTFMYHQNIIPRWTKDSQKPMQLYHGINMVLILDDSQPIYHGPVSTSLQESVGLSFSEARGLLWTIKSSYRNKFKFITGISVDWISQHKHETEIILMNQYLPIKSAKNFDENLQSNVDHLMYSIKSYSKPIHKEKFYSIIGIYFKHEYISLIKNHQTLYDITAVQSKTVLERLTFELGINEWPQQYHVLSTKFDIKVFDAFNCYSIRMNVDLQQKYFDDSSEYKFNDEKNQFKATDVVYKKNRHLEYPIYNIWIKNIDLFRTNEYILLQTIEKCKFKDCCNIFADNLKLFQQTEQIITLNAKNILSKYHREILQYKYIIVRHPRHQMVKEISQKEVINKYYIYRFDDIEHIHFIAPFEEHTSQHYISIYVQFMDNDNYISIKNIHVDCQVAEKVDYLLKLLKIYRYEIKDSKTFFKQIGFDIGDAELNKLTAEHSFLRQSTARGIPYPIIRRLVEELDIHKLKQLSKYYSEESERRKSLPFTNHRYTIHESPQRLHKRKSRSLVLQLSNVSKPCINSINKNIESNDNELDSDDTEISELSGIQQ